VQDIPSPRFTEPPKILTLENMADAWAIEPPADKNASLALIGELSNRLNQRAERGHSHVLPHILYYGRMLYMMDCRLTVDELLVGFKIYLYYTRRCIGAEATPLTHYDRWFGREIAAQFLSIWNSLWQAESRRRESTAARRDPHDQRLTGHADNNPNERWFVRRTDVDDALSAVNIIDGYKAIKARGARIIPDRNLGELQDVLSQGTLLVVQTQDDGETFVTTRAHSRFAFNPDQMLEI
jgi:hypothetical protein